MSEGHLESRGSLNPLSFSSAAASPGLPTAAVTFQQSEHVPKAVQVTYSKSGFKFSGERTESPFVVKQNFVEETEDRKESTGFENIMIPREQADLADNILPFIHDKMDWIKIAKIPTNL